jgi:hypothetical protein
LSKNPHLFSGSPQCISEERNHRASDCSNDTVEISEDADDPSNNEVVNIISGLILAMIIAFLFAYDDMQSNDIERKKIGNDNNIDEGNYENPPSENF